MPGVIEAGCDEAGRGCLCGPVCAAAVILPEGFDGALLNDSKQLTAAMRDRLREQIEREAIAWAVEMVDADTIDRINILNASILAMHGALRRLGVTPQHIIVDGNRFKPYSAPVDDSELLTMQIPHTTVVKGDAKYMSIAAASILAKTHRDEFMQRVAKEYPGYGIETNMGYPTPAHKEALRRLGPTPYQRKTFKY